MATRSAEDLLRSKPLPREPALDILARPGSLTAGAGLGLGVLGLLRGGLTGIVLGTAGAALTYRGLKEMQLLDGGWRQLLHAGADHSTTVEGAVTVERPVDEVYAHWRQLERLPLYVRHIERVVDLGDGLYEWAAQIPGTDQSITWTAEIIEEVEGERLVWRSVEGSEIHNEGIVSFRSVGNGNGDGESTEVRARIGYRVPGGAIGKGIVEFIDAVPRQLLKENLRDFKHLEETGEIPTIEGQPSGRAQAR